MCTYTLILNIIQSIYFQGVVHVECAEYQRSEIHCRVGKARAITIHSNIQYSLHIHHFYGHNHLNGKNIEQFCGHNHLCHLLSWSHMYFVGTMKVHCLPTSLSDGT